MRDFELEFEADLEDLMASLSDLEAESETSRGDVACNHCHEKGCFELLQRAIKEAIRLANTAADRLEASIRPGKRDKWAKITAQVFQTFFCHDPLFPVAWDDNRPSGASVAKRLRAVAHELGPGRRIRFVCMKTLNPDVCNSRTCCPEDFAVNHPEEHFKVFLCVRFWDGRPPEEVAGGFLSGLEDDRVQLVKERIPGLPEDSRRAGIIIHEVLHLLFDFNDEKSPRRFDPHCYTAFVLRVNGLGDDPTAVRQCQHSPC